jgi:hypothetical protein
MYPSFIQDASQHGPRGKADVREKERWAANSDEPVLLLLRVASSLLRRLIATHGTWMRVMGRVDRWMD